MALFYPAPCCYRWNCCLPQPNSTYSPAPWRRYSTTCPMYPEINGTSHPVPWCYCSNTAFTWHLPHVQAPPGPDVAVPPQPNSTYRPAPWRYYSTTSPMYPEVNGTPRPVLGCYCSNTAPMSPSALYADVAAPTQPNGTSFHVPWWSITTQDLEMPRRIVANSVPVQE